MAATTREARSRIMSAIRKRDTKPELAVRRFLHAKGLRYRLHFSLLRFCFTGKVALAVSKSRDLFLAFDELGVS